MQRNAEKNNRSIQREIHKDADSDAITIKVKIVETQKGRKNFTYSLIIGQQPWTHVTMAQDKS